MSIGMMVVIGFVVAVIYNEDAWRKRIINGFLYIMKYIATAGWKRE